MTEYHTESDQCVSLLTLFFFQAEDGIRDLYVTGVQTCALPIFENSDHTNNRPNNESAVKSWGACRSASPPRVAPSAQLISCAITILADSANKTCVRSEERRVGKEWRSREQPLYYKED